MNANLHRPLNIKQPLLASDIEAIQANNAAVLARDYDEGDQLRDISHLLRASGIRASAHPRNRGVNLLHASVALYIDGQLLGEYASAESSDYRIPVFGNRAQRIQDALANNVAQLVLVNHESNTIVKRFAIDQLNEVKSWLEERIGENRFAPVVALAVPDVIEPIPAASDDQILALSNGEPISLGALPLAPKADRNQKVFPLGGVPRAFLRAEYHVVPRIEWNDRGSKIESIHGEVHLKSAEYLLEIVPGVFDCIAEWDRILPRALARIEESNRPSHKDLGWSDDDLLSVSGEHPDNDEP